jgi:hypothetical protein
MPLFRCINVVVPFIFCLAGVVNAQTEKALPTDEEINLVLTQTERALQQYKPLIEQEDAMLGKEKQAADGITQARQVVSALETAITGLKSKPQGFNGAVGFAFFEWLDDASRNALLCSAAAFPFATVALLASDQDRASSLVKLAQTCSDASTLLYTVSENVGALYLRYERAEDELLNKTYQAFEHCTDMLKSGQSPKRH